MSIQIVEISLNSISNKLIYNPFIPDSVSVIEWMRKLKKVVLGYAQTKSTESGKIVELACWTIHFNFEGGYC